jgi:predicted  nucleic acid-binding Zn-ribbon protein
LRRHKSMLDENSKSESKIYKSPVQKLFRFFEASRDKWKDKCLTAKYQIKLLTNRIRYLEKCKKDLSNKVKELEKELKQLKEKKTT